MSECAFVCVYVHVFVHGVSRIKLKELQGQSRPHPNGKLCLTLWIEIAGVERTPWMGEESGPCGILVL